MTRNRFLLLLSVVAILGGCAETAKQRAHNGGLIREQNEGYSLLYKLMSDESGVDKIFMLKHADEPLGGLVKEIAISSKSAKAQMDTFLSASSRVEFDVPDLPKLEQDTRDLEAKEEAEGLLFSSGKKFETRLMFTQAEAMDYAANLCLAISAKEDDAGRKAFLTDLSKRCASFSGRLLDLLAIR